MAYARIETSVRTHRKFLTAGPAACWLWACGLMYCQEGLTDGHIPAIALQLLGVPGKARSERLAAALVAVGLWDKVADGWAVHDYLEHNKSAEDVRAIKVERRKAGSQGGRPKKQVAFAMSKQPENPASSTATSTATDKELRTAAPSAPRFPQAVENLPESHPPKAPRHPRSKDANGDNYRPILGIAHEVLRGGDVPDEAYLRMAVKARCHQLGIRMDLRDEGQADALGRACASAWASHRIGA